MARGEHSELARHLFVEASKLPATDRLAWLLAQTDDQELLASVRSMLEGDPEFGSRGAVQSRPDADATLEGSEVTAEAGAGKRELPAPMLTGYRVLGEPKAGGMGVVYQARDVRLDRLVAIKTILGAYREREHLDALRKEAKLAARLRHPNIVAVHALLDDVEPPCVVMEWVDGVPANVAAQHMSYGQRAALMLKIAKAVAFAHEKGVVHRDLKPGNILVDREGEPRLLDFGLARAILEQAGSGSFAIKGTLQYMAPEQVESPSQVGPSADVHSLGLILYTFLTGRPARPGRATLDLQLFVNAPPPLPRDVRADIPEPLQRIVLKASEVRPSDRYDSAHELALDLERFLQGRPVTARPTRYAQLLDDRVRMHIDAIRDWERENLIGRREADSLQDRYALLLADAVSGDPKRLRPGTVLLQAGGWMVVLSTALWTTFYWNDLDALQRVLAIGFPTLIVNAGAFAMWGRSSQFVATTLTIVGALLIPFFLLVLCSASGLLTTRATEEYELFPPDYFTNRQLSAALWIGAAYTAWLLWRNRLGAVVALLCAITLLAFTSSLLLAGLKHWITQEWYATTAAAFAVVPLLAYASARTVDHFGRDSLAWPPYAISGIGFILVLAAISYDGPKSWLGLTPPDDETLPNGLAITREIAFISMGFVLFAIAVVHDHGRTRLQRLWGRLYYRVVPPSCIIPLDLLGNEPLWSIGRVGQADLYPLELGVPLVCIAFLVAGTQLQLRWFVYYGLIHLAVFVLRTTERHFSDYFSWPVVIIALGAVAMMSGLWIEQRRQRLQ